MEHMPYSDSPDPFNGVRVAITGGTSGLGLVRELLRRGRVVFVARTPDRVEQVAREHAGAHGVVGDVSLKADIYPIAMQIVGELGGLDVLVNNASDLGPTPLALLGDTDCEDSGPRGGHKSDRAVPPDQGTFGGAGRVCSRGQGRGGGERLQ